MTAPSAGSDRGSFSGVVRNRDPRRPSFRPPSGKADKKEDVSEETKKSPSFLGDPAAAAGLADSRKNTLSHSTIQPQPHNGETVQNCLGQGGNADTPHGKGVQALLIHILSQLGFTQDDINNSEQLKGILTQLGLDADQIADLLSMQAAAQQGEAREAFLARLVSALEEKGMVTDQAKELSQMVVAFKAEEGGLPSTETRQDAVLKDMQVQMGVGPEEAQKAVKEGELSVTEVKKILAQLGWDTGKVHEVVKGEKVLLGDLKNILEQLGVKTGNLKGLIAAGENANPESVPKGLLEMFDKALQNLTNTNSTAVAFKGDVPAGDNSRGRQDGTGNGDPRGEGQLAVEATGGRSVPTVGQDRGDFEQMMSRADSRGPAAQKVVEQIVEGARVQVAKGQTKAKIFLRPPSLGKLNLHIITREDQVRVTFFAENLQVKEIIENNLPQLRQSFVQQGLQVNNFDVFVGHQPSGQPDSQRSSFGGFRSHWGENGKPGLGEGEAGGGARRWLSGNHRVDLFI